MLRFIIGRAGTGKTAAIYRELRQAVERRESRYLLLVPEQYSHEAERELCRICGDRLSLTAEVFSFTGLARRVAQERGGLAAPLLDKGGRLLCMALAMDAVSSRLDVYRQARQKAELQALLLRAVDELKTARVSAEQLEAAAERCGEGLDRKLRDLSLIMAAYDAVVANGHADPSDRLDLLAGQIADGALGPADTVYVDGFLDFTYQEQAVLEAMLRRDVSLTVCLTLDEPHGEDEIFALSRSSLRRLAAAAKELGVRVQIQRMGVPVGKAPALRVFVEEMFRYGESRFRGDASCIRLGFAESVAAECEAAAARVLSLVRDGGCRWRDVAVAVRGFEDYRSILESVFRQYGIPLFATRRSELLSKPLPALISLAYEIVGTGWDVDDMLSYLGTGLTGLSLEESDLLSNYIFKWQLRGGAWARPADWRQHPDGYGAAPTERSAAQLAQINALRRRVAAPLQRFADRSRMAETAAGQASALAGLLEDLELPRQLEERSARLGADGREELAAEYRQLWELIVSALEQCAALLGDMELDAAAFGKLFLRMLAQYDIGLIPVSLDRVSAGDFDRMRRRSIKHLLVLGCSEGRLPMTAEAPGIFDYDERERLLELDIDLGGGVSELWREFSLIYNCLSLPAESLYLSFPLCDADGEDLRPAYVYQRAQALFGLRPERLDLDRSRLAAPGPALTLAAHALQGGRPTAAAAAAYFREEAPERFAKLERAAALGRGKLSPEAVEALYGKRLYLSASRIDRFASCRFSYFCQYGLKAKPYEPAGFQPPEIGTFMHAVLEDVVRRAKDLGGCARLDDEQIRALTKESVERYVREELDDLREKSSRFVHLFRRLCGDVEEVVLDTVRELRRSDFQPLDFELDFSKATDIRPLELGEGEGSMTLTGIADRIDGWVHEDKLYLRVVDYKTGRKSFSLSDVWYGMGLQMLLYLLALQEDGAARYGREIVPAGVMYLPARDLILSVEAGAGDEEIAKKRADALRRSGLVLDDAAVLEAWEKGEDKRYIPVKLGRRSGSSGSLASLEQLGVLFGHLRGTLTDMARQLRQGSIAADPYYRSQQETACLNCDYLDACFFSDGEAGESCRYQRELKDAEVFEMLEKEAVDHG
ncbi:MAG: PD-(D/E)XK nuclease family protein [Oscillospiraceae bacterium]|nr:PD-(D/E)XK nuclease family protein [Oscillospiraceae bacterium]